MSLEIVTKEDLQIFRLQLLNDIKAIVQKSMETMNTRPEGYKTGQVRAILGCSINKLVSLRNSRKVRVKKIGGTLYYNKEDIRQLLEEGY